MTGCKAHRLPRSVVGNVFFVGKSEIDVVIFGFATDAQSTRADVRKNDAHQFSEGCGVERLEMVFCAAAGVLSVDTGAWDGAFGLDQVLVQPCRLLAPGIQLRSAGEGHTIT
jgi:hypothetical protein